MQACLSMCISSSTSVSATEVFRVSATEILRVTPGVRCLLGQTVNSSAGKLVLKLVMTWGSKIYF